MLSEVRYACSLGDHRSRREDSFVFVDAVGRSEVEGSGEDVEGGAGDEDGKGGEEMR